MLLKLPPNGIVRKETLKNHFPTIIQRKPHIQSSHPISQATHNLKTLQFSFFSKITSTVSFQPNIFVNQRLSHSALFSLWATREIDVQGK